jgi:hypothetical protein
MKTRNCRRALPVDMHRTTSRTEAVIVDIVTALVVAVAALVVAVIVAAVALPIVWALVSAYRWVL